MDIIHKYGTPKHVEVTAGAVPNRHDFDYVTIWMQDPPEKGEEFIVTEQAWIARLECRVIVGWVSPGDSRVEAR